MAILIMPFIEVDIENNNSAGIESCQYKPLIGRQSYTTNCAVCLLKLGFQKNDVLFKMNVQLVIVGFNSFHK